MKPIALFKAISGPMPLMLLQGAVVVNPLHAALFLGGCALTEKVAKEASCRFAPGTYSRVGPIPCGIKSLVSHGLAIYTTLKVMQIAGLILSVPTVITYLGLASAAVLAVGCINSRVQKKPFEQQLKEITKYSTLTSEMLYFDHEGKTHGMRIICNPYQSNLSCLVNAKGHVNSRRRYIVACNDLIPPQVKSLLESNLGNSVEMYTKKIGGILPIDFTANPQILHRDSDD